MASPQSESGTSGYFEIGSSDGCVECERLRQLEDRPADPPVLTPQVPDVLPGGPPAASTHHHQPTNAPQAAAQSASDQLRAIAAAASEATATQSAFRSSRAVAASAGPGGSSTKGRRPLPDKPRRATKAATTASTVLAAATTAAVATRSVGGNDEEEERKKRNNRNNNRTNRDDNNKIIDNDNNDLADETMDRTDQLYPHPKLPGQFAPISKEQWEAFEQEGLVRPCPPSPRGPPPDWRRIMTGMPDEEQARRQEHNDRVAKAQADRVRARNNACVKRNRARRAELLNNALRDRAAKIRQIQDLEMRLESILGEVRQRQQQQQQPAAPVLRPVSEIGLAHESGYDFVYDTRRGHIPEPVPPALPLIPRLPSPVLSPPPPLMFSALPPLPPPPSNMPDANPYRDPRRRDGGSGRGILRRGGGRVRHPWERH